MSSMIAQKFPQADGHADVSSGDEYVSGPAYSRDSKKGSQKFWTQSDAPRGNKRGLTDTEFIQIFLTRNATLVSQRVTGSFRAIRPVQPTLQITSKRWHGFTPKAGTPKVKIEDYIGKSVLDVAHDHGVDLEGACEASLACSTCHVIFKDTELYKTLPEPSDEENDMLDLAFGLTETSRLGCQIILSKELDGMELILPSATRNMAVDGFKPKPH
ncbi:hypothetical protein PROFUN_05563 [Planoprotostelium fungivorum]|uniref:2Fe-2S ferredoxin-type domain-containing protein n=1 Tax=Planoprotostelium fungivorum TaxID=1890364 RepID=A0A2P6N030_9EUKA|nr:hypothetical protein PROFUN_05563 [Planoprotostelium fungivorum]